MPIAWPKNRLKRSHLLEFVTLASSVWSLSGYFKQLPSLHTCVFPRKASFVSRKACQIPDSFVLLRTPAALIDSHNHL